MSSKGQCYKFNSQNFFKFKFSFPKNPRIFFLFPCMAFSGFPSPKFRFHFKENIKLQKECVGLNSETATIKIMFQNQK